VKITYTDPETLDPSTLDLTAIHFSASMVRAVLDGRKFVTRRFVNVREAKGSLVSKSARERTRTRFTPGSVLAVREPTHLGGFDGEDWALAFYDADGEVVTDPTHDEPGRDGTAAGYVHWPDEWHERDKGRQAARFMPYAWARLFVGVASLRFEPLQAITDDDAILEGVECVRRPSDERPALWGVTERVAITENGQTRDAKLVEYDLCADDPREAYFRLWDRVNAHYGPNVKAAANPTVARIEFRPLYPALALALRNALWNRQGVKA
jgi:hypothetical protein